MKHKKRHITLFLILIGSFLYAQQYKNYSTKDGLPSNHVYTILQDAKGFMWFLTDKGMVKYNGKNFKTFTTKQGLPNNDVWEAFTTPDGKIWYFSKSTKLGYIKNDSVVSYYNQNKNEIINPVFSSQIKDSIYPAGPNKSYRLKDKMWQIIKLPTKINGVEDFTKVIHDKVDYIGINYTNSTLNVYNKNQTNLKQISAKDIIYNKNNNRGQVTDSLFYWVTDKQYYVLNFNTLKVINRTFKDEVGIEKIKHSRINLVDNKLQITGNGFVGILDKDFHISNLFYFPEKLNAHFGFIDKQNTIWLSTFNRGVYKLPNVKKNIVYQFEDKKIQKLNSLKNDIIISVFNQGFYKYNKFQKTLKPYITSKDFIYGVSNIEALNKNLFFSNSNVFIEQDNKITTINFDKEYAPVKNINLVSQLKQVVYYNSELYGIYTFGIYKLDDKTLTIKKDILKKGCNDFLVFNSRLIIATNNGLFELKNDSIKNIKFKNYAFNKSIINIKQISKTKILINTDGFGSYVSDLKTITPIKASEFLIVQDAFVKDDSIWLATNTGVLHLKKDNNSYKLVRNYTADDGLPNKNVNTVYVNNKDLIVGTNSGLATLPINQNKQDLFIDLFIDKAIYNNLSITDISNTVYYKSNTNLSFEVSTIDFSEMKNTNFSYRLEPIQEKWIKTTSNTINFNNLKPDNYVFHIQSNGVNKKLNFIIKPLWWQTNWSKTLVFLLILGLIFLVSWKLSKKAQEKRNIKLIQEKQMSEIQLKALRSQMNPHFVFNSLAAIQFYINNNEIEASEAYLVKFSILIRQFFELSKETEICLAQEVKLIENYLDIEKLRFKDKFEYNIQIESKLNTTNIKLPTMLLQPIVENAVNHGIFNKLENGTVTIRFNYLGKQSIKVEITDDGVGFINTKKRSKRKVKSSNVLEDRLKFLNQSGLWDISYSEEELNPYLKDRGSKSTFIITQL